MLKEEIKFLLHNCFLSVENIITIQVIGIPMGSDAAPFFANLFLAQKETDWVNEQRKPGTIAFEKSIIHSSLSMTCYHYMMTLPLRKTIKIFIQQN